MRAANCNRRANRAGDQPIHDRSARRVEHALRGCRLGGDAVALGLGARQRDDAEDRLVQSQRNDAPAFATTAASGCFTSMRDRGDIPLLVEYFIERFATQAGRRFRHINKKGLDLLQSYDWPGNIRELQDGRSTSS